MKIIREKIKIWKYDMKGDGENEKKEKMKDVEEKDV